MSSVVVMKVTLSREMVVGGASHLPAPSLPPISMETQWTRVKLLAVMVVRREGWSAPRRERRMETMRGECKPTSTSVPAV